MDILFVESTAFSQKVDSFLNENEQDSLRFLLAVRPLSGEPSAADKDILELLFAGCYISYAIGANGMEIYLLNIAEAPTPAPTQGGKDRLRWIRQLVKIFVIQERLEKLRCWMEERGPPDWEDLPDWEDWDDYL